MTRAATKGTRPKKPDRRTTGPKHAYRNYPIHIELWTALKTSAAERKVTAQEELHRVLCKFYRRPELLREVPECWRL